MEDSERLPSLASAPAADGGDRLCNLKETELRLGLPGSGSPERQDQGEALLTLGLEKGFVSGAKRGFSDAIDGSGKWVFTGGRGSQVELAKGGLLFSSVGESNSAQHAVSVNSQKEKAPAAEKKSQVPPGSTDAAPAAK